ncbi:type II toxin-antitoxin system YafQ family toxin [Tundrisphaera sp. TA3]|uniref:type II toxin-antitoxin system RelE/ParE family toxin n=1 Tax=Tundrisphaera sp. TA3 TaxID=3435775 RepID=UPI003EB7EC96
MNRALIRSTAFVRAAKRVMKRNPDAAEGLRDALVQLADDAFHPFLKSHKLKGELDGLWACSAGYDLRIVFSLVRQDDREAILLQSVGTHDEVF